MKKEKETNIVSAKDIHESEIKNISRITWIWTYPNKEYEISKEDIINYFQEFKKSPKKKKLPSHEVKKLVAVYNNKVVGFCILDFKKKYNEIRALYVLPDFHGKGIGKMLFDKAIKSFKNKKHFFIRVAVYNKKAIDFYKKNGFKIDKRFKMKKFDLLNGKFIPMLVMIKSFYEK